MPTDGFVVLQLTATERLCGSSNVFDDVDSARARRDRLSELAPSDVRLRVAAVRLLEDTP